MNLGTIPGFAAELAHGKFIRNAAYLPLRESICGVPVRPLSLYHLVLLETVGSPFLCGGRVTVAEVGAFLWIVSPHYQHGAKLRQWFFLKRLGRIKLEPPHGPLPLDFNPGEYLLDKFIEQIRDYIREAEVDLAAGTPTIQRGRARAPRATYHSKATVLIDILASEYGWDEATILHLPLKRLLAYRLRILERTGQLTVDTGAESKQRWLEAANAKARTN